MIKKKKKATPRQIIPNTTSLKQSTIFKKNTVRARTWKTMMDKIDGASRWGVDFSEGDKHTGWAP